MGLRFPPSVKPDEAEEWIGALSADRLEPVPAEDALKRMKFSESLPPHVADRVFLARFDDAGAIRMILAEAKKVTLEG